MPVTHKDLKDCTKSRSLNHLEFTDVAEDVQNITWTPVPKYIKPIWPFISFTHSILFQMNLKLFMVSKLQKLKR